jgi:hypothetical protein
LEGTIDGLISSIDQFCWLDDSICGTGITHATTLTVTALLRLLDRSSNDGEYKNKSLGLCWTVSFLLQDGDYSLLWLTAAFDCFDG